MPRLLWPGLVGAIGIWVTTALGQERLTLQQLERYAPSYQLHLVTLEGHAFRVDALPPRELCGRHGCWTFYGRGSFILRDGTSQVKVESFGSRSPLMQLPEAGDRVRVTGMVQAEHIPGEPSPRVTVQLRDLVVLQPDAS